MSVPKREATALLQALSAGVVPRSGLRHIAVGRLQEIKALKHDLDHIRDGGATARFVIGRFGSGKSFLLQLARAYALESKFVVADVDFTPERRLYGSVGQALATYRELMKNLSTQTRPEGNALPVIIERWISSIQSAVLAEQGGQPGSPAFTHAVQARILKTISAMEEVVHGFDFGMVMTAYYRGHVEGNDRLKTEALRWLRGEMNTKTEARETLGVRSVIDDDSIYDYLKAIAHFIHQVGYAGLLVCFDESVNLYKITSSVVRNRNYEIILNILNDCLQGGARHLGVIFSGTPEFLEDPRRGLYSYGALRSRLAPSRFATEDLRDYSGPVLTLPPLTNEEVYVLLQKVRDLHQSVTHAAQGVSNEGIIAYLESALRRAGASSFITPRELIREFVNLLNLLAQYPDQTWQQLLGTLPPKLPNADSPSDQEPQQPDDDDPLARFTDFRVS